MASFALFLHQHVWSSSGGCGTTSNGELATSVVTSIVDVRDIAFKLIVVLSALLLSSLLLLSGEVVDIAELWPAIVVGLLILLNVALIVGLVVLVLVGVTVVVDDMLVVLATVDDDGEKLLPKRK